MILSFLFIEHQMFIELRNMQQHFLLETKKIVDSNWKKRCKRILMKPSQYAN